MSTLETGASDSVERTREAAHAARSAHGATARAHVAHMRLLDADSTWRQRIRSARGAAAGGATAAGMALTKLAQLRAAESATLEDLRRLTEWLCKERRKASHGAGLADVFALCAFISHVLLLFVGVGKAGWRLWLIRTSLVGLDAGLVCEGALKDAWAARMLAVFVLLGQTIRASGVDECTRPHYSASRQAIFLARSMKRSPFRSSTRHSHVHLE